MQSPQPAPPSTTDHHGRLMTRRRTRTAPLGSSATPPPAWRNGARSESRSPTQIAVRGR